MQTLEDQPDQLRQSYQAVYLMQLAGIKIANVFNQRCLYSHNYTGKQRDNRILAFVHTGEEYPLILQEHP